VQLKGNFEIHNSFSYFFKRLGRYCFIIISSTYNGTIPELLKNYYTPLIIFDATFNKFNCIKRKHECEFLGIPFYSISEQGAYQKTI
jgi:hypothetical protein